MNSVSLLATSRAPALNRFLRSPLYVMLVSLLILASSIFALDIPLYTVLALLCCVICLFGDDLLPLAPIITQIHMSFSMDNNPGANPTPIFSFSRYGFYLVALVALVVLCLVFRIITDKRFGGKAFFTKKRILLPGMLILFLGYALGGNFSDAWIWNEVIIKSILFSVLQLIVIAAPYLVMTAFVDWENTPRDYLLWVGAGMAALVFGQVIHIYLVKDVIVNGTIVRESIVSGWGMRNNVGGMLAMMVPCLFYLGIRYKKAWLGIGLGSLAMIAVALTTSRSSLVFGGLLWVICAWIQLRTLCSKRTLYVCIGLGLMCMLGGIVVFWDKISGLFHQIVSLGFDSSNRDLIWAEGMKQFGEFPLFGGSFFPIDYTPYDWSTVSSFSNIFPPRWHNTIVQLLASTGIVGLCCYTYHRYTTVKLFLKNRTVENTYLAFCLVILLGTSLLDCHFFNFGPVLYYSIALAFMECASETNTALS